MPWVVGMVAGEGERDEGDLRVRGGLGLRGSSASGDGVFDRFKRQIIMDNAELFM